MCAALAAAAPPKPALVRHMASSRCPRAQPGPSSLLPFRPGPGAASPRPYLARREGPWRAWAFPTPENVIEGAGRRGSELARSFEGVGPAPALLHRTRLGRRVAQGEGAPEVGSVWGAESGGPELPGWSESG